MQSTPAPFPLDALDQGDFVAALEGIFEHSPWVAERAWPGCPFGSLEALRLALVAAMMGAPQEDQLALLRAHPELAGKEAVRGELTRESTQEQAGAGLKTCTPEEVALIQRLNAAYREKFGWPFIVAVRGLDRYAIIARMEQRLAASAETEFAEALAQVALIAGFRLADRFGA